MKHATRLSRACAAVVALAAVFGAAGGGSAALAQTPSATPSATPDTAIFQITNTTIPGTPTPTPTATPATTPTPGATPLPLPRDSFAGDISGNGRFVVIESNGDIATNRSASRNNADGNHEIFLFDYAQRRIFQITNTTSALRDTAKSPVDFTNIDVAVVNLQPSLSRDGKWIVFASNAYSDADLSASPKNFVGANHTAALKADGNTEIFIYRIPDVADIDLSQGTEVAEIDLTTNTPQRVTFTDESSPPRPAGTNFPAFFSLDNYAPSVNDDGSLVAFTSKARTGAGINGIVGANNPDGNKEVFLYRNSGTGAGTFLQLTATADVPVTGSPLPRLTFNENPSISSCTTAANCRIAFISNADNIITEGAAEADANEGNGEIFVVEYSPAAGTKGAVRQITRTPPDTTLGREGVSVNVLSPGRRISRDGSRVAFESTANAFNSDGTINGAIAGTTGIFIANVTGAAPAPAQVSVRAPEGQFDVELHFPTFTGDSTRVLWASNLNLKTDGTVETTTGQGLNQTTRVQIFSAPADALTNVARVTNLSTGSFNAVQPFPSDTIRRMALTLRNEQGGGNPDGLAEAHYQFIPPFTTETPAPSPTPATTAAPVSFFTGASDRAVVPTPTPPQVSGLAPGMLGIARSTLTLAPATVEVDRNNAHETQRRPPLPVELSGVTVTVAGAAAGLYFVAPNQINFVVPPGLPAATSPVAIFNNGTLIRTSLVLNAAQPDIFTSTNGPGGRAAALNVTNPCVAPPGEPFTVTTTRPAGSGTTGDCTSAQSETVATQIMFLVTGVRGVTAPANVTVRIGTTDITGTADPNTSPIKIGPSNTPGFDQITVTLPASLAGAGDVPVIITVTAAGGPFSSRPADTAPRITILPNP
ncbi:MAG TPA: hypothetical protein VF588_10235 [Pyrinomonadaceae bacterium]